MYNTILSAITPIFICTLIGFSWAKLRPDYPTEFIGRIVMNIGAPCLFISSITSSNLSTEALLNVMLAAVGVMITMATFGFFLIKLLNYKMSVFLPAIVFPNVGNMGLPLSLFIFGNKGLALSLGVFLVFSVTQFTLGILLINNTEKKLTSQIVETFKQPIIYAAAIAVTCLTVGYNLPRWLANTTDLLGGITVPLMLITLGVSLANLKVSAFLRSLGFSIVRVFGGLLSGFIVVSILNLEGTIRGVILLQSAMPVAVFNYLLAVRYKHSPSDTASMVIISTVLVFMILPLIIKHISP